MSDLWAKAQIAAKSRAALKIVHPDPADAKKHGAIIAARMIIDEMRGFLVAVETFLHQAKP
ncbi:MAG: hypothetical protein ACREC6_03740 [Hyphomicrobiaceae bacterium]